jgi:hypothetical protein
MKYKGYEIVREELVELGTGRRSYQWAVYIGGCPLGSDYCVGVFKTIREAKEHINR